MENNFIYLDNASTTPLSENVLNIINSTYRNYWYNPSSTYELGIKCSTYLEKIRYKIAYILGLCNSQTIVTLPGGNLKIDWSKDDCEVMMTGNANNSYKLN